MAIVKCYKCEREVSDSAAACPHCGAPFARSQPQVIRKRRGMSTGAIVAAVLASVIICGGLILFFAALVAGSNHRSCLVTTVENIQYLGQNLELYMMEYRHAPWADDVRELQEIFEETDFKLNQARLKDGWGNDLIYEHSGIRIYTVMSYGSDGIPGPRVRPNAHGDRIISHFDEDIIWSRGRFVQHPKGARLPER